LAIQVLHAKIYCTTAKHFHKNQKIHNCDEIKAKQLLHCNIFSSTSPQRNSKKFILQGLLLNMG